MAALSPSFLEIFSQSSAAESYSLMQVAGPGYKKALEFLVKDYCCTVHSDKADNIKGAHLGAVINTYLGDARVKELAERAAWLGNDESHYVRKWADKDISHLKDLIRLTVSYIDQELVAKRLIREMPRPER